MVADNFRNDILRRAVKLALTGGTIAAAGVSAVQAQQAPADAADTSAGMSEVVVTGSRISVPNQVSISPVTFVSAEIIEQTGATRF